MGKLSYTQIASYTQCGQKFNLHYNQNKRNRFQGSALVFGSALDVGLNKLLLTRNVDDAIKAFDKALEHQFINGKSVPVASCLDILYSESDFDHELLQPEDFEKLKRFTQDVVEQYKCLIEAKKDKGFKNLEEQDKLFFNYANFLSLRRKGHVMIKSYNDKIMPKILEVKAVQHKAVMMSSDGDELVQYVDLIVVWEDGSVILFDNKTTSKAYSEDSAKTSQQLISYYYQNKEDFGLTAIGYITMNKHIIKNKKKTCLACGKELEQGSRVKKCDQLVNGKRCSGEFDVKIDPECAIQVIVSPVTETAIDLVLSTFDDANDGIKNQRWYKNLGACDSPYPCPFKELCWFGNTEDIIELPKKE